jgi:hypothetical protein
MFGLAMSSDLLCLARFRTPDENVVGGVVILPSMSHLAQHHHHMISASRSLFEREFVTSNAKPRIMAYRYIIEASIDVAWFMKARYRYHIHQLRTRAMLDLIASPKLSQCEIKKLVSLCCCDDNRATSAVSCNTKAKRRGNSPFIPATPLTTSNSRGAALSDL